MAFAAALLVVVGCTYERSEDIPGRFPATLQLRYLQAGPFAKSADIIDQVLVEDVNVYVADSDGNIVYQNHFWGSGVSTEPFDIYKGSLYTVYVLANWGQEKPVADEDDLLGTVLTASDPACPAEGLAAKLLCGKVDGVVFPLQSGVLDVQMERILSHVNVKCDFSGVGESVEVVPVKVSIKNVPVSALLFAENVAEEVCSGAEYTAEELDGLEASGVDFLMFENIQGNVGNASGNKQKAEMMTQQMREVATYVEMECNVVTPDRRGVMVYRFFLGTDHSNCNVLRNARQSITVKFNGAVSQDENSVSVDNSAMPYRIYMIRVSPTSLQFTSSSQSSAQCTITLYPGNAVDSRVEWTTSNSKVATVDQNGLITTRGKGTCYIYVTSKDCPSVQAKVMVRVNNYTGG